MEIDKDNLEQLLFGIRISSGPPVFIFYSPSTNDLYTTLYFYPRSKSDEVVFKYEIFNSSYNDLRNELETVISKFKPRAQIRDDKLGDLLK